MRENNVKVTALLGWSLQAIEAIDKMNRPYVVVGPPEFELFADTNGISFVPWQFDDSIEKSDELYEKLRDYNTKMAVPIYEETVEWAGSLNAKFQNNPRIFNKSLLFKRQRLNEA